MIPYTADMLSQRVAQGRRLRQDGPDLIVLLVGLGGVDGDGHLLQGLHKRESALQAPLLVLGGLRGWQLAAAAWVPGRALRGGGHVG